jgi:hypothetical protein
MTAGGQHCGRVVCIAGYDYYVEKDSLLSL